MPAMPLIEEVAQFVPDLEAAQIALGELFEQKRTALSTSDAGTLMALGEPEAQLVKRLQLLLATREHILDRARADGRPVESLRQLVVEAGDPDHSDLVARMDQASKRAGALRQESWIHWIIANRAHKHYSEVLEIIAHRGEAAVTYEREPRTTSGGGAILDASV